MRTPFLIACIAATSMASAAGTSGLWWYATTHGAVRAPSALPVAPPPLAEPVATAPAAVRTPAPPPAPAAIAAVAATQQPLPSTAATGWGQTTATWGDGAAAAPVSQPQDAADPVTVLRYSDPAPAPPAAPPAEPAPAAPAQAAPAPAPVQVVAADPPPDDGTVPPAYFVDCGVATSDYSGFAPPYCARYGMTQQELLTLALFSHQCGCPLDQVIGVYVGQCGRCLDQVAVYYQIDPSVFFVALEPGTRIDGCLLRPYLWFQRGCVGPTNFSNRDYEALIALKIGCEWDGCPQGVVVAQLEGGWSCSQVLIGINAQQGGQAVARPTHVMRPILRRPTPAPRQAQHGATGGWGASHPTPGWEQPSPAAREPVHEPAVGHVTVVHGPHTAEGAGGEASLQHAHEGLVSPREEAVERPETVQRPEPVRREEPVQREAPIVRPEPVQREEAVQREAPIVRPEPVQRGAPIMREPVPERAPPAGSRDQGLNLPNSPNH